ncbi:MAG: hypothetical protein SFU56_19920 [Capsulimonadales bacterium]|nr:hypothetical protein [Capsulimonadales bacterium]
MNQRRWLMALALMTIPGTAAFAQDAAPLETSKPVLQTPFTNQDLNGWKAMGGNARVSVTTDETRPGGDKNVLQMDYSVVKGEMNFLYLTVNDNEITQAKSFRFAVKADYATTLAMTLQEKDGGRYSAAFHVPPGKWQTVVLSPSDFSLARENDAPVDTNGKLDLDQVNFVGLADAGQYFAQAGDPTLSQLFGIKPGSHSLKVADFTISRQPVAGGLTPSDARIDSFAGPQVNWLATGGVELAATGGKPLNGRGFSASYRQSQDRFSGFMRDVGQGKCLGKTALKMTLASEKAAKVIVQLEEKGGGKYNAIVTVPEGNVATPFVVRFADLKPADDSKDDNSTFDQGNIHRIVLIDVSGFLDKTDTQNTLHIGDLRFE